MSDTITGNQAEVFQRLPDEFNAGGFALTLVERRGNVAVYEQTKDGRGIAYELGYVQKSKARIIDGREIPAHEAWPSPSQWGKQAWTVTSLQDALERLARMTREEALCC